MRAQPWLFRRLVALGLLPATTPIYVFSEEAANEVARLNGSVSQERLAELAPMPHNEAFAIEMSVSSAENASDRFRTLTAVFQIDKFPISQDMMRLLRHHAPSEWMVLEIQACGGKIVVLPSIFMPEPGKYASILDNSAGNEFLRIVTQQQAELVKAIVGKQMHIKHARDVCVADVNKLNAMEFNKRAGEAVGFLTSACAVLASPAISRQSETMPLRLKAPSGRERKIETRWTNVDIDIDRQAQRHSGDEANESSGIALHPVRAHLRVTNFGISKVRAHMRGDARFGVRHRVGSVNRAGE